MSDSTDPVELTLEGPDAEVARQLARSLRGSGTRPLHLHCEAAHPVDDAEAFATWVRLLASAPAPRFAALPQAELGPRGLAVMLSASCVFIGRETRLSADWQELPGLCVLARAWLPPAMVPALLLGGGDLLETLCRLGAVHRHEDPQSAAAAAASRATGTLGPRLAAAARAAAELPFAEAFDFDVLNHIHTTGAR